MRRVLNFGSMNVDYVYSVEHFVGPGETLASLGRNVFAGGKGLNQSIALSRAGANVFHAGCAGRDDGEVLLDALRSAGVNTDFIETREGASGHTIIQVDKTGQNCILLFGGANHKISEEQIKKTLDSFEREDFILLQNEINLCAQIANLAAQKGMKTVYNPSPADGAIYDVLKQKIDFLIVNEVEAAMITGEKNTGAGAALDALAKKFPDTTIILTCGKLGVYCAEKNSESLKKNVYHHGVYDVKVVDTTAAGDTFTGFFIASIIKEKKIEEALRLASEASSVCVSRRGAADSVPSLEEVARSGLRLVKRSEDAYNGV